MNGASERSRTVDLLITNELLYQLSYTGRWRNVSMGCKSSKKIGDVSDWDGNLTRRLP